MEQGIYLDNSTISRPSDKTLASMLPFLNQMWGASSAPHQRGQELFPFIETGYRSIYTLLEASEEDDFVLTSSGAEAVNQVVMSTYFDVTLPTGKNHFLTSCLDEAPAILAMSRLEQLGCKVAMIPADREGKITLEAIVEAITPRTALISLSWANGLTGTVNPVKEIAAFCRERGILFHLEASHVLGKLFFDLKEISPDFLSFNGGNLHAPKGTGGLWIKAGKKCSPLIVGGFDQGGYRAGCLDVPALVALGHAAEEAMDARNLLCTEVARLRHHLEEGIQSGYPDAVVFFRQQERLPHCCAIGFPGISNEAMLYSLNRKGVFASIGGGHFQQIGLLLMASGVEETLAHSSVNFSLSRETSEEEIEKAIEMICETAKKRRKISGSLIP